MNRKTIASPHPISPEEFSGLIAKLGTDFSAVRKIAVAVSGGGDSTALTALAAEWCAARGIELFPVTVDHGLRPESADEARAVARETEKLGLRHTVLRWSGEKPKTRIQESARDARYALMTEFCKQEKITHLFLAHHGNDQTETILFRMLKSTGADGLAGMKPVTPTESGVILLRPLLSVGHRDLIETCRARGLNWIEDPSNGNSDYTRVRLRKIAELLEEEGLTPARIDVFAGRMAGIVDSVTFAVETLRSTLPVTEEEGGALSFPFTEFLSLPFDMRVRLIKECLHRLSPSPGTVRLEEIERLVGRMTAESFRGATLGQCLFRKKKSLLHIAPETIRKSV